MSLSSLTDSASGLHSIVEFSHNDICSFLLRKLRKHHRETYLHSVRVAALSAELFAALGLPAEEAEPLLRSVLLHDIGKISIDPALLNKQGPLRNEEWQLLKHHCRYGFDILDTDALRGWIDMDIILYHHENLDGTGYYGLKQDDLPLGVKIVRVADSFDAMTEPRAYCRGMTAQESFEELYRWSGVHYDPDVVAVLYALKNPEKTGGPTLNMMEMLNRLRDRLVETYLQYGSLSHPEVVKASQNLDQALNEFQLH
ncbi:HD domain-containing phosphohydrolase [Gordoniibacillus kamchatkensis]|uniref:HD domain-containing phosphohydrolase n=1 Tax=Gordoniibacillus kamchatkensis TaxID=1590651 RepID=UPI0006966755|nr:HD domain-containing phosphohydrolase [Paenibacillus sp. VKM B-2647]